MQNIKANTWLNLIAEALGLITSIHHFLPMLRWMISQDYNDSIGINFHLDAISKLPIEKLNNMGNLKQTDHV